MAKKNEVIPPKFQQLQFFYGDGVTPDPCLRDRHANETRLSQLEARQASQADGLDRSVDDWDPDASR